ncbi:MAG TPA: hypothetical protein DIT18_04450 [Pseudomonas sp.]|nr:hypothetical protein [Pseudomonas sp.]
MITEEENTSLKDLNAQQRAEFVPQQYFDVISNRSDNSSMQPALIFTSENLSSIKRYVHYVLRLPKSIEEITGSHNLALIGLDATQVDSFYTNLRTHVAEWDVLERETKTLGTRLDLFAKTFIEEGGRLIEKLENTEAYRSLKGRLGDIVDEVSLERVSFKAVGEKDREQLATLGTYLNLIKEDVDEVKLRLAAVKERARWFTDAVVKQLRPEVDGLSRQIKEVNPEKTIATLREQVAYLDNEIAVGDAAYKKLVGFSFAGLAFGPFGLLVSGGVFGSQAEKLRKSNRKLKDQRQALVRDIASINPMIGVFEATTLQIADLTFRLTEVHTAAKNLEDVWNMLGVYVEQSGEELGLINNDVELATFMLRFQRVVRPWTSIRDIAAQLSQIFNETVDEISKEGASE